MDLENSKITVLLLSMLIATLASVFQYNQRYEGIAATLYIFTMLSLIDDFTEKCVYVILNYSPAQLQRTHILKVFLSFF